MGIRVRPWSRVLMWIMLLYMFTFRVQAQQIAIPRVQQMPNLPSPYMMRDWKAVARDYDALVFDRILSGQYLPLIWMEASGVNYPEHAWFGLHTAVGTYSPGNAEAINVLPAVIGASLAGIDKSQQDGVNWVLMCEEFFNRRPAENVYLNAPVAASGSDWWYDTMPNVFFYQLYDLYPHIGHFDDQFRTVADRWLTALAAMGGSTTPWRVPSMNYRAWSLSTMTGLSSGVREPEAAGALAWLLYHAFIITGDSKYRIGAEWALEFLNGRSSNPSYELQLPYGACVAARMNAELGTDYNLGKIVNWCFDPENNVRDWGVTLGNWGGYDCDGLVGEAEFSGYAFAMNTFEQVGTLVPMVRYDDRFARAVGKWVLNAANASRLFYSEFLPDTHQDNEAWVQQFDPNSCIAYEALREVSLGGNTRPYATGDFMRHGWGATNLVLYGSSHVGILGGIIDTTDVEGVLQLDVLKTDYFHGEAYPTYLYFNPYDADQTVQIDVSGGMHDLYDAVSNTFVNTGVTGETSLVIPADASVLVVVTPAGGTVTYQLNRLLIDGVVVDYRAGQTVFNHPPRIKSLAAFGDTLLMGQSTTIYCTAVDRDEDGLSYTWTASGGMLQLQDASAVWTAPSSAGSFRIACIVNDSRGGTDSSGVFIDVLDAINHTPTIERMIADPRNVDLGGSVQLTCTASDPDDDDLTYSWSALAGSFSGDGSMITWNAPILQGLYFITCTVDDGHGAHVTDSIYVVVQDFSKIGTGIPVAYYPFTGNADDASGYGHHGIVSGATLTEDRFGNADHAYLFDGSNDVIRIPSHPLLDFREAISVSFWMKIGQFFDREAYPISHGNWENRWKVSVLPASDKRIRWTVKTDNGIKDLDSQTRFIQDECYNITVLYDGTNIAIYVNGELDAASAWSGLILKTPIDLTIGQVLPANASYNFKGVLDEVRIYSYALSLHEIQNIYNEDTGIPNQPSKLQPDVCILYQNHPNPFNGQTEIVYRIDGTGPVLIELFNVTGRKVITLVDRQENQGLHRIVWDGKDERGHSVPTGVYFYVMKAGNFSSSRKLLMMK